MKIKISIMTIIVMLCIGLCSCEREDNTPNNRTGATDTRQNNNHGNNPSDTLSDNPGNIPGNNYRDTLSGNPNNTPSDNTEDTISGDWVDLGLPSGLLWATRDIGAATPEDEGDLFAWGETTPKDTYTIDNYIYYRKDDSDFGYTKYTNNGYHGFMDMLFILQACDDAATVNWGNGVRTPTKEEWIELGKNCKVKSIKQNGVLYMGPNGRTIFLKSSHRYWSATVDFYAEARPTTGNNLDISNISTKRYEGCWVRAVRSAH